MTRKEMGDCSYNVHKQLVKRLQFVWHSDGYLKDATHDKHRECAAMWRRIVENERENIRLLQEAVDREREMM